MLPVEDYKVYLALNAHKEDVFLHDVKGIIKHMFKVILLNNMFVSPSCFFFSSLDNFSALVDLCHNIQSYFPWRLLHIVFPDLLPSKGDKLSPITLTDRW